MWLWVCVRPYLFWLDVILLTAVWGGGINDHALLGEQCIILTQQSCWVLYHMSSRTFRQLVHEQSDILFTFPSPSKCLTTLRTFKTPDITWAVGHYFNLYMSRRTFFQLVHEPSDIVLTWAWGCMGLDGSTSSQSIPVGTCHFEPLEHVPWTSARA